LVDILILNLREEEASLPEGNCVFRTLLLLPESAFPDHFTVITTARFVIAVVPTVVSAHGFAVAAFRRHAEIDEPVR
jgi:hypothetical protein